MATKQNVVNMQDQSIDGFAPGIVADGTTVAITRDQLGKTVMLNSGAACAITLPKAKAGDQIKFVCSTTTHASTTITAASGEFFDGAIACQATDTDAAPTVSVADGSADDVLTLNGTTTGGINGSWVEMYCEADGVWHCIGYTLGSGTLADCFSAP